MGARGMLVCSIQRCGQHRCAFIVQFEREECQDSNSTKTRGESHTYEREEAKGRSLPKERCGLSTRSLKLITDEVSELDGSGFCRE